MKLIDFMNKLNVEKKEDKNITLFCGIKSIYGIYNEPNIFKMPDIKDKIENNIITDISGEKIETVDIPTYLPSVSVCSVAKLYENTIVSN
jgi:hypothetical protein